MPGCRRRRQAERPYPAAASGMDPKVVFRRCSSEGSPWNPFIPTRKVYHHKLVTFDRDMAMNIGSAPHVIAMLVEKHLSTWNACYISPATAPEIFHASKDRLDVHRLGLCATVLGTGRPTPKISRPVGSVREHRCLPPGEENHA